MKIPEEIRKIIRILEDNNYESYIVGGCVRDLFRGKIPHDWDITTIAKPDEIQDIFKKNGYEAFYENEFGTVGVVLPDDPRRAFYNIVEITTFRTEGEYVDRRHPEKIEWAKTIEEDLARRDFTMNAIGLRFKKEEALIVDPFGGQKDIKNKIIKAVGDAHQRFLEDALRMMRAIRLATTLEFEIESKTKKAIKENAHLIKDISEERIRDEFVKTIMSNKPHEGIELLRELGVLKYIIPEIEEGYKIGQNKHHIYDCYTHSLFSLKYAAKKKFGKHVRIAALLHDVGKPRTKKGEGADSTFYNHEIVGARMTRNILNRLKFPKKDIDKIVKLVRYHLFYYNVDEVSESSVRRLIRQVGLENMDELLEVRMCDRIGSGVPKAEPYKLRHLRYLIDKLSQDPISPQNLKIGGNEIMDILKITPGPKIGWILDILLGYVLSDPKLNNEDFLKKETEALGKKSDKELINLSKESQKEREMIEMKKDKMTKEKYWVT